MNSLPDRVFTWNIKSCITIHRYPIFSTKYSVICKVYTGYCGTSEKEHGLRACTVDNPLAKARGLSLRTGAQTMLYLPLIFCKKKPWKNIQDCHMLQSLLAHSGLTEIAFSPLAGIPLLCEMNELLKKPFSAFLIYSIAYQFRFSWVFQHEIVYLPGRLICGCNCFFYYF